MARTPYAKIEDKQELKRLRRNFSKWKKAAKNKTMLDQILKDQGGKCATCSNAIKFWTELDSFTIKDFLNGKRISLSDYASVDHIVPLSWGGGHEKENIQILCHTCNSRKGNKYEN